MSDSALAPGETPTGKLASGQQSVLPLASVALRGMQHHAAELDSGSRRSPLAGLGVDLPVLRFYLPGLRSDLRVIPR